MLRYVLLSTTIVPMMFKREVVEAVGTFDSQRAAEEHKRMLLKAYPGAYDHLDIVSYIPS